MPHIGDAPGASQTRSSDPAEAASQRGFGGMLLPGHVLASWRLPTQVDYVLAELASAGYFRASNHMGTELEFGE